MEEIKPGKYYEIAYKLFRINPDGSETLVHEVTDEEPDRVICAMTPGVVEALDEELLGKKAGDTFDFTAAPERAFGPYSQDDIYTVPREHLTIDGKFDPEMFAPGALVPLMTSDGFRIDGTMVRLTDDAVVLDLNHPLAKDSVHYVGHVVAVRDPKPEELQPAGGGCCGGGCCGGQGDCNGGDCQGGGCQGGCC